MLLVHCDQSMQRVFTKMDLWWGYNNVRIKKGDKWKVAFTTHMGSYEPVVMFFGMTNLPTTFQGMMNEILRDMINEGKVAAFVDDILIETEIEEGHDEIIEEIMYVIYLLKLASIPVKISDSFRLSYSQLSV